MYEFFPVSVISSENSCDCLNKHDFLQGRDLTDGCNIYRNVSIYD